LSMDAIRGAIGIDRWRDTCTAVCATHRSIE
jgi:hypothetical protein